MSDEGEFYCHSGNYDGSHWRVTLGPSSYGKALARFFGPHAEADAREHVAKCNARAAEERKARPKCEVTHYWLAPGKRLWRVCHATHGPIADFYETQPDAEQHACDYAARLNAEAQPEPPKPSPRYYVDTRFGHCRIRDHVANATTKVECFGDDAETLARAIADMLNADAAGEPAQ